MLIVSLLIVASFMTGVNWLLQVVDYPLFLKCKKDDFSEYNIFHSKNSVVVMLMPMLVDLIFSILFIMNYSDNLGAVPPYINIFLTILILYSAFFISYPIQERLYQDGYNAGEIKKYIKTNWIRTIAWTLKLGVLFYCLTGTYVIS